MLTFQQNSDLCQEDKWIRVSIERIFQNDFAVRDSVFFFFLELSNENLLDYIAYPARAFARAVLISQRSDVFSTHVHVRVIREFFSRSGHNRMYRRITIFYFTVAFAFYSQSDADSEYAKRDLHHR